MIERILECTAPLTIIFDFIRIKRKNTFFKNLILGKYFMKKLVFFLTYKIPFSVVPDYFMLQVVIDHKDYYR